MTSFSPRTTTLRGRLTANAEVASVFPLFAPEGERLWVPGWDPEFLHPPEAEWEEGQIFRTREEMGDAVWLVTRLDRAQHTVEYYRVESVRYVAHITVSCRPRSGEGTDVTTTYSFVGLSESGNREIAAMTQQAYDEKMSRWAEWINQHLATHEKRPDV